MAGLIKKLYPISLVLQGFSYRTAKEFSSVRRSVNEGQAKSIMRMLPFDVTFDKMFADLLTTRRVLNESKEDFPKFYGIVAKRDEELVICPLEDAGTREKLTAEDIIRLLTENGSLNIRPCFSKLKGRVERLSYADGTFSLNGAEVTREALTERIDDLTEDSLIIGGFEAAEAYDCEYPILHAIYLRDYRIGESRCAFIADHADGKGRINVYSGKIVSAANTDDPIVRKAYEAANRAAKKYPEAPYLDIAVVLSETHPTIWQVDSGKELIWLKDLPKEVSEFLELRRNMPVQPVKHKQGGLKRIYNYAFAAYAKKKGFLDYMYRNWLRGVKDDNLVTTTTAKEKRWAHKRGFYSYRIKQYGLTEENYRDMLSDYEYKRLRPINGWYQKWLWDKVFMYYVMSPYHDVLPKHFYRIVPMPDGNKIISFDLNADHDADISDLIALITEQKRIVAKPAIGSHGQGFYKMEWDAEQSCIRINNDAYTEMEFADFIKQLDKPYFLSEYVEMHEHLKRIYDGVVGTVRVMVIDIGGQPKVASAYMRIGSSKTGHTDNLDSGGLVARVNAETGRYDEVEMLWDHKYVLCDTHPDTGTELQGYLPNWEFIKERLAEIAAYLYPLEYLGFDVVITPNGFQLLEINTHQDLHRYPEYPQEVKDYFKRKSALKK